MYMGQPNSKTVHIELTQSQAQAATIALGAQIERWKDMSVTHAWSPKMGHIMDLCQAAHRVMVKALVETKPNDT